MHTSQYQGKLGQIYMYIRPHVHVALNPLLCIGQQWYMPSLSGVTDQEVIKYDCEHTSELAQLL